MDRVRSAAERLGAKTFDGIGMEANQAWIESMKAIGTEIIDIGPDWARRARRAEDGVRPDSPFYNMERMATKTYDKYIKAFTRPQ